MNAFSIIPIVALLFNGAVWSYIFINRKERPVNNSFLLYSTNLMLWIIVEIILRQPLSTEYIMPLIKIDSIMSLAPTFWFLNFTYTFIGRKRDLIYYISSTSVFTIILVSISTNLILADYLKTSWGYDRVQGVLYFPAIIIAIILPAIYSVYLIIEKIKTTSDYTYKKSLPLILIGSLISLMLGLVSNVIIPHIFNNHDLVQFGESTTVVQSYFILVAVIKYKLFTPSVEDIANDLFASMKEAVLILDKGGKILQLNAYAKKLFGSKVAGNEEVINVNNLFSNFEINKDVTDYEVNYISDSEKKILSLSQIGIINKDVELGKILIARDITERKRAEEALSESEAKFRWLFENVPDGIYLSTPDGKLVNVNDTLVQMLGYNSKEELLAADIVNELYMNPSERTFWIGKLEVNGKLHSIELHLKRKDGTPLLVRENAHLLADESGKLFYEGTLTDITKLKEAEKALRSSEIRFRSVWESSAEGMLNEQALKKNKLMMNRAEEIAHLGSWELDLETNKLNCSAELYQIYGLQHENFDGKFESILKLVHPEDSGNILANIKRARESNEPFEHYERIIRPDGENRILYTKGIILDNVEGNAKTIYGSCLDVTEFKRVENALINSSEKLRALSASLEAAREEERSHIARELHDELGQVLTAIKMDLTLMQDDLLIKPDSLKEEITGMKERAKFLGGKVFIDGQEGKGTRVFLEMPLSPAEDLNKI